MSEPSPDIRKVLPSAEEKFFKLKQLLSSNLVRKTRLGDLESIIDYEGRELLRLLLQDHICWKATIGPGG
jgi:hypothetical protein